MENPQQQQQQQQTRIPKFGVSRLPVPHLRSPSGGEPSYDDLRIGRRVRVTDDREGVLRYVGNVEFCNNNGGSTSPSATYWCGIELDAPLGKNDGFVRGVRYFTCRPGHGLMVPSSKVTPLDAYEDDDHCDPDSGPYSLIFAIDEPQHDFLQNSEPKRRRLKKEHQQQHQKRPDKLQLLEEGESGSVFRKLKQAENLQVGEEGGSGGSVFRKLDNLQLDEGGGGGSFFRRLDNLQLDVGGASGGCGGSVFRKLMQKELLEENGSKRNSLDMDESSLGILTPNQIEAAYLDEKVLSMSQKPKEEDRSTAEFSFGLLDEQLLNNLTLTTASKTNADVQSVEQTPSPEELPFDPTPINAKTAGNTFLITNLETGGYHHHHHHGDGEIITKSSKTVDGTFVESITNLETVGGYQGDEDVTKNNSKTSSSAFIITNLDNVGYQTKTTANSNNSNNTFVTSITSITSLDTGYQGDGEMSRPASRGAENAPLTRRPAAPRGQVRKQTDPMTDSDFYTESEADLVEENNPLRGDRRVQVIDGTLYGVDPQAAADIYANNRENMDSSGIFTDLENNTKTEEESSSSAAIGDGDDDAPPPPSPSEASTKTISENSQQKKPSAAAHKTPSPITPKPNKRNNTLMKKGEQQQQQPLVMKKPTGDSHHQNQSPQPPPQTVLFKKPFNKWDAVMNKITKGDQRQVKPDYKNVRSKVFSDIVQPDYKNVRSKVFSDLVQPDYKNVRSKVFNDVQVNKAAVVKSRSSSTLVKPTNKKPLSIQSAASTRTATPKRSCFSPPKSPASAQSSSPAKKRRLRQPAASRQSNYDEGNVRSSTLGSRRTTYKSPQLVLRAESPKTNKNNVEQQQQQQFFRNDHKGTNTSSHETTETGTITDLSSADIERLENVLLDGQDKLRLSNVRIKSLEVKLLKEIDRNNVHEENIKLLEQERNIQEESRTCTVEKSTSTDKLNMTVNASCQTDQDRHPPHNSVDLRRMRESLDRMTRERLAEKERSKRLENELSRSRNELEILGIAQNNLERVNSELRESIRLFVDNIHKKQLEANELREEVGRRREELEGKEAELEEQRMRFGQRFAKLEAEKESKEREYSREYACLKEEFERLLQAKPDFSEKESLKLIIDMKREEIDELKRSLAIANEEVNKLKIYETKSNLLMTRVEQLEHQLEKKTEREQVLLSENKKLEECLREESNQKRRSLLYNEELQWKLKQSKEVMNKIIGYSEEFNLNKSILTHPTYSSTPSTHRHNLLERSYSFRERNSSNPFNLFMDKSTSRNSTTTNGTTPDPEMMEEWMGPKSPKVKSVVEKSESLSYVLDLDDSPDVVASRIIRRSFRQNISPKNKSPSNNKRALNTKGNPLSQSASSSAILTTSDKSDSTTTSNNIENLYDDVKDLEEATLPKLPIDGDGVERLPSPEGIAEDDKSEDIEDEEKLIDLDEDDTSNTEDGA